MVAQQQERAAVLVAFVATGLIVCGTGCSGGGTAAEDVRTGPGTAGTLRQAVAALERAGSAKASTSMEMATGGTRVTIRGQGVYDFRKQTGRLKVLLPQDPAGAAEHRPITELLAPGALFMKNRGAGVPADKWVRVETAGLTDGNLVTGGATDPYAAAELLRGARSVTYVGKTELAGISVRHYRGTADLGTAARDASAGQRPALRAAAKGFATTEVPFDAYLDDEGRLRKVRHRFSFVNGQRTGTVAVASTLLLYDFGSPAVVRLPDSSDIYAGKIAE
uniref:Lipoprotein n=1 Tax=Streptomyces sp. NBC_01393 TaxID=2903851 RepID=A0AAU3I1R5_9ACTN